MKSISDKDSLKLLLGNLVLAPQDLSQLSFAKTTVPAVRRFVRQLPQPTAHAAQQVYGAIKEVSQLNARPALKFAILDVLAQPVRESIQVLTERTNLNQQTYTAVSLALAILKYQAMSYKSVLISASADNCAAQTDLLEPMRAALKAMNEFYLQSLIFYVSLPKHFWHELHTFYRLIKLLQLENLPRSIADPQADPQADHQADHQTRNHAGSEMDSTNDPSLLSLYLKPLLLSTTNPAQYAPAEIKKIYLFLEHWADMAQLNPGRAKGLFVIDLDSDNGPHYEARFGALTSNHIRLQTHRLVNLLRDRSYETRSGTRFVPLPARLADGLCRSWGQELARQHQHVPDQSDVEVLTGFTMIHDNLTELAEHQHQASSSINVESGTGVGASQTKTGCCGQLRNSSHAGIQLSLNDPVNRIAPGDFVCFRTCPDKPWSLGLVRWLNVSAGLNQVAGVETMSHKVEPCVVKLVQGERSTSLFLPGLRFIDITDPDSVYLATLPQPFRVQNTVTLVTQTSHQSVQLVELCKSTFHIAVFRVEITSLSGADNQP